MLYVTIASPEPGAVSQQILREMESNNETVVETNSKDYVDLIIRDITTSVMRLRPSRNFGRI